MEFSLENTCNLECVQCHGGLSSRIRQEREKRPPFRSPYDSTFFEELFPWLDRLAEARFSGGEPFLIEAYYRIWERLAGKNPDCEILVQTNGTVLSPRVARVLEQGRFNISVSLDSLERERFESLRKGARLGEVMSNLEYFRDYCRDRGTYFGLSICVMPGNWEELPSLLDFASRQGAEVALNLVTEPLWASLRGLDAKDLEGIQAVLERAVLPESSPLAARNLRKYRDAVRQVALWAGQARNREGAPLVGEMTSRELMDLLREKVLSHLEEHPDFLNAWEGGYGEVEAFLAGILAGIPEKFTVNAAHSEALKNLSGGRLLLSMERYSQEALAGRVHGFLEKAVL
ncbi:MAG: radical SAM protein [Deltaproteobacteria bacterium]|nr:radical SAM protein [Deltaproteobacteria bacterium]